TSVRDAPLASRWPRRFAIAWRSSPSRPPGTSLPSARPTWPETTNHSPARTTGVYGPTGLAVIATSFRSETWEGSLARAMRPRPPPTPPRATRTTLADRTRRLLRRSARARTRRRLPRFREFARRAAPRTRHRERRLQSADASHPCARCLLGTARLAPRDRDGLRARAPSR